MKRLALSLAALGAALAIHTTPATAVDINPDCSSLLPGCQVKATLLESNTVADTSARLPDVVCEKCTLRFRWEAELTP